MEHLNIFKVSNINTTLRFLKTKGFWVSAFDVIQIKILLKINGQVEMFYYLDLKVLD